ncbi:formate dehydrogenase family accessory protein FdhD [Sphingomonas sp. Leaf407]|uniref:formate dehydrogenase accessory sulfurtransferase FdhD n=1 Tax=unclassified Sphingomonas TaxID=196159 RepID=UPI0006FB84D2|nr:MULTISPECIES: formate dehydrogenase accessory sulfurtransferase FdhD [unclassified Sphingomonas]KQN37616.1 formate dehydrogenase family accessory protein FdhD [Sphingomonas sp. Leaf42]KQT27983.1 formate dehydrogenase family accessory protein FdhD [Sphingomonas sp. Leaf407]
MSDAPSAIRSFARVAAAGTPSPTDQPVAVEAPVAIEIDGLGYAVLMATPADLADLATGFALAERLIDHGGELVDVDAHAIDRGTLLRLTLIPDRHDRVAERVRHRVSESSCGLCGIENLEQALRPLPPLTAHSDATPAAILAAAAGLRDHQPLSRATGAAHAAALCAADGTIRLVREDVGRHNAFDKLIGAMRREGHDWDGGFALLSSRCSFELVEKAVLAGCPLLATLSAATSLAIDRAATAGLPLRTAVRGDAMLAS